MENQLKTLNNEKLGQQTAKNVKSKTLDQLLKDNPNHLNEIIQDNKMNLYHNAAYFFEQADVPAMLDFLRSRDIQIEMRGTGLEKTVEALSHFMFTYNDYKRDFDLFATQEKWVKSQSSGQFESTENIETKQQ